MKINLNNKEIQISTEKDRKKRYSEFKVWKKEGVKSETIKNNTSCLNTSIGKSLFENKVSDKKFSIFRITDIEVLNNIRNLFVKSETLNAYDTHNNFSSAINNYIDFLDIYYKAISFDEEKKNPDILLNGVDSLIDEKSGTGNGEKRLYIITTDSPEPYKTFFSINKDINKFTKSKKNKELENGIHNQCYYKKSNLENLYEDKTEAQKEIINKLSDITFFTCTYTHASKNRIYLSSVDGELLDFVKFPKAGDYINIKLHENGKIEFYITHEKTEVRKALIKMEKELQKKYFRLWFLVCFSQKYLRDLINEKGYKIVTDDIKNDENFYLFKFCLQDLFGIKEVNGLLEVNNVTLKEIRKYLEELENHKITDLFFDKEPDTDLLESFWNAVIGPQNKIIYGAPGTGKSWQLKDDANKYFLEENISRTTFYHGLSYEKFVGAYKPKPFEEKDKDGKTNKKITYEYVSGIFMETLIKALNDKSNGFLLIIEEINRAKADSIFGEIFQLLDRDEFGESEYGIKPSEELKIYLKDKLEKKYEELKIEEEGLKIPSNMRIWATMNSADQGVHPMDTAFKRRWSFDYVGLNDNAEEFGKKLHPDDPDSSKYFYMPEKVGGNITWNKFRTSVNNIAIKDRSISEDRLLAPFFIKETDFIKVSPKGEIPKYVLRDSVFLNKIIMYLFDDLLRHKPQNKIFNPKLKSFFEIKEELEKDEPSVFNDIFSNDNSGDS